MGFSSIYNWGGAPPCSKLSVDLGGYLPSRASSGLPHRSSNTLMTTPTA